MPKISATMSTFTFDKERFTRELDRAIKSELRAGIRAFLIAALQAIPIRTGFASGSLENLASRAVLEETPAQQFKKITRKLYKEYYKGVLKTPEAGKKFATPYAEIISAKDYIYTFNFESFIDYFNINDALSNPRTPSSPWNSFSLGEIAMSNYLDNIEIPDITDFIVETSRDY